MGCDRGTGFVRCISSSFNPRTHMGCDSGEILELPDIYVSIHAPTWGATPSLAKIRLQLCCFNPRTHMGCDAKYFPLQFQHVSFNPRTHMGCDGNTGVFRHTLRSFNPRTHMGCDGNTGVFRHTLRSFNPRTHMGCDHLGNMELLRVGGFQSTHPHGVRPSASPAPDKPDKFQSTHPHGVRRTKKLRSALLLKFQSTHPHGVRPLTAGAAMPPACFNPRTHMGCDLPKTLYFSSRIVSIHAPTWGATHRH